MSVTYVNLQVKPGSNLEKILFNIEYRSPVNKRKITLILFNKSSCVLHI
jgi:hypothetical protein